jgi:uncharacterized protein (DUF1501 family)
MKRRDFIHGVGVGAAAAAWPRILLGQAPSSSRLVFVLLRGGLDGLAAVVPTGDPAYASLRQGLAYADSELVGLSDGFGLAPGLAGFKSFWDRDELAVIHAMAIPYRTRSHFDGQAILESGLDRPSGSADGWLNRVLQVMGGRMAGIAIAAGLPRSMTGPHSVTTWSPATLGAVDDGYLDRLHFLYRRDPALADPFEAALELSATAGVMAAPDQTAGRGRIPSTMAAAARFLRHPDGPNVAAVEFGGWDTHANQGRAGGALDRLLEQLAGGMSTFRAEMGETWGQTTVVVMTEFGRTARGNGTRGTDHGTGGVGFVLGPRVGRSRILADWPGLGEPDLYDGRDLAAAVDTREVLRGVLGGVFDMPASALERVFPGTGNLIGMRDLMA